ncbi:MAG: FAD-binding oxidoreductase [Rhizomicrobium sp.]|jgi:FAD/FMN-containing dehydrogenase
MGDLISRLSDAIGSAHVLTGADAQEKSRGWSRLGKPLAIVRPASTQEVSTVVRLCHDAKQPLVAWGGKTGLVDGGNADGAIALSLERMNTIEAIDAGDATVTVEAGCTLQSLCEAVDDKGLFFPLDLGARGSATIGGNISTNAGGNRVLRYGMMREQVLGLEAVLADGTILSSLNHLIKNNAGYDLKQLFIGTEGTLGIVTRAVLRLRPKPAAQAVALLACDDFDALPRLLRGLEKSLGGALSAFEAMWEDFYTLVTTEPAKGTPPVPHGHPYYVLAEALGGDDSLADRFETALADALERGDASDAVIAKSQAERNRIWALRDDVGQVLQRGPIFTFDVSLRLSAMKAYVAQVRDELAARWPQSSCVVFGHLGDGNLHVIVGVGDKSRDARKAVEHIVYGALRASHGSISAEHGISLEKRDYLSWSRAESEIALMRTLKRALDPENILNPGKIFEMSGGG